MIFTVQIINNTVPALSVVTSDGGTSVTYKQFKESLGAQSYMLEQLYLYSENINQLLGVIQYQRFDSDGNQLYTNIATTIDPYSGNSVAINIDLSKYDEKFVLNGNSSFNSTILPATNVRITFTANRITNEFGRNLDNFQQIEIDANKPDFFNNYGATIQEIKELNAEIEKTATLPPIEPIRQQSQSSTQIPSKADKPQLKPEQEENIYLYLLGFIALVGLGFIVNREVKN
jgi:hypothetical protein